MVIVMELFNRAKAYFGDYNTKNEEYKRTLWEHEQLGYKIYSLEMAIKKLKEEENESMGA